LSVLVIGLTKYECFSTDSKILHRPISVPPARRITEYIIYKIAHKNSKNSLLTERKRQYFSATQFNVMLYTYVGVEAANSHYVVQLFTARLPAP